MLDTLDPFREHDAGIGIGPWMGDHADTHALEAAAIAAGRDNVNHLLVGHGRPVDADEVAVGIVAFGLAMAREPVISTIRPTTFRISQQQIEAERAIGAV